MNFYLGYHGRSFKLSIFFDRVGGSVFMGQNSDGTFTEIRQLVARDVDMNNKLKLSSLFAIVQDTANAQCMEFGCGWKDLMTKYNVCYILSRMRFELNKHPGAGDSILIRTWPNNNMKAIFTRYFTVEDLDGNVFGSAISQWALFDVKKRGVIRPSECGIVFPDVVAKEEPFSLPKGAMYSPEVFETAKVRECERFPSYADFDYNRHVNNAKYVEWVEDALPLEFFAEGKQFSSIDIKYKHEISFDEYIHKTPAESMVKMECAHENGIYSIRSILSDGREGIQCVINKGSEKVI